MKIKIKLTASMPKDKNNMKQITYSEETLKAAELIVANDVRESQYFTLGMADFTGALFGV